MLRDIKTILTMKNPWWQAKTSLPEIPPYERSIVDHLTHISKNNALILLGPRQSGKTTSMYQAIRHLVTQVDPLTIVYAPMDLLKEYTISEIITAHQELTTKTQNIYYFFDEIHYDKNWSITLKTLIDEKTGNHYCATGSSSTLLLKDATESGIGRFSFLFLSPLSFREYVTCTEKSSPTMHLSFIDNLTPMVTTTAQLIAEQQRLEPLLQKYLLWGGFPAQLSQIYNISSWQNALRQNYVSLTIYKDVLSRYEVRDPRILEDLLLLVAEKTTLPLSYDSIAKSFHLTLETTRTYLNYLEAAGLIITCEYFTKNILKQARRNKKFYAIDPGFNAALNYENTLSDTIASKNVETAVAILLLRYLQQTTGLLHPRLFYWKEKHEVDFIIKFAETIIPVEVKYTKELNTNDLEGLIEFMEIFSLQKGIVVTKNVCEQRKIEKKDIYCIPASLFLAAEMP